MDDSDYLLWLPQTKLAPPRPHTALLPRRRLLDAIGRAVAAAPVTLLSAPTGSGKTTLLAGWLPEAPAEVAWLSLDAEDNDPALFFTALIAAVRRADPAAAPTARALLAQARPGPSTGRPSLQPIVGALINDLGARATPLVIVLDDLHLIGEPAIVAALDYLIAHMPPGLRLLAAARHDPPLALARLRARGLLAELRLGDLSFTGDEVAALLNERLGLGLSGAELAALHRGTEGWAAGLRLAAGSVARRHAAGQAAVAPHARPALADRAVDEVLLQEVLDPQPPELRAFLLETSILEELTPPLCAAVTGRADAAALLDALARRNLFLSEAEPDQAGQPAYRYHALFAAFLRRQLARERPAEALVALRRRAAAAEPAPARAIAHELAAGLWEEAADRITAVGGPTMRRGFYQLLAGWIAALPPAVRDARPRLHYLLGVCAWQQGELAAAQRRLEQAYAGFLAAGDAAGQGEALVDLAIPAFFRGDFDGGMAYVERAMPLPVLPRTRAHLLLNRCGTAVMRGSREQAEADAAAIVELLLTNPDEEMLAIVLAGASPYAACMLGLLDATELLYADGLAAIGDLLSPGGVAATATLAAVALIRGRVDEAAARAEQALAASARLGGYAYVDPPLLLVAARAALARGEAERAGALFERALRPEGRIGMHRLVEPADRYLLGRAHWQAGRLDAARAALDRMGAPVSGELPVAGLARGLLRAALAIDADRHDEAEAELRALAEREQGIALAAFYGSARPLLAHLEQKRGRPAAALAALEPLLAECAQYGTPGRLIGEGPYVVPLLRLALGAGVQAELCAETLRLWGAGAAVAPAAPISSGPARVPTTGATLTPRELEVLRLAAGGLSNHEIAERLVVGSETIKTHMTRILHKLQARSRTEAASRARELGLV